MYVGESVERRKSLANHPYDIFGPLSSLNSLTLLPAGVRNETASSCQVVNPKGPDSNEQTLWKCAIHSSTTGDPPEKGPDVIAESHLVPHC